MVLFCFVSLKAIVNIEKIKSTNNNIIFFSIHKRNLLHSSIYFSQSNHFSIIEFLSLSFFYQKSIIFIRKKLIHINYNKVEKII